MKDMEYVRIRGGNPDLRVRAEEASRHEEKHSMELLAFSFEQFDSSVQSAGEDPPLNTRGGAGSARIELDTGNFSMDGGVFIESLTEDITIETPSVTWEDAEKRLRAPGEVMVTRSDGTALSGRILSADMRRKSWEFDGAVGGTIILEE
jgi:hypothetical protein